MVAACFSREPSAERGEARENQFGRDGGIIAGYSAEGWMSEVGDLSYVSGSSSIG